MICPDCKGVADNGKDDCSVNPTVYPCTKCILGIVERKKPENTISNFSFMITNPSEEFVEKLNDSMRNMTETEVQMFGGTIRVVVESLQYTFGSRNTEYMVRLMAVSHGQ